MIPVISDLDQRRMRYKATHPRTHTWLSVHAAALIVSGIFYVLSSGLHP